MGALFTKLPVPNITATSKTGDCACFFSTTNKNKTVSKNILCRHLRKCKQCHDVAFEHVMELKTFDETPSDSVNGK